MGTRIFDGGINPFGFSKSYVSEECMEDIRSWCINSINEEFMNGIYQDGVAAIAAIPKRSLFFFQNQERMDTYVT